MALRPPSYGYHKGIGLKPGLFCPTFVHHWTKKYFYSIRAVERQQPQERREMTDAKVVNSPVSRTHARVDCVQSSQSSSQTGFINKPIRSQTTGAGARVRAKKTQRFARISNAASVCATRRLHSRSSWTSASRKREVRDDIPHGSEAHPQERAGGGGDVPDHLPQPVLPRRPALVDLRHREARKSLGKAPNAGITGT